MTRDDPRSVLVVGGGIVGIACAYYLRRAGLQVTILDQATLGGACSHANCGYVCPSHVPPLTEPGAIGVALKSLFYAKSPFRVKPTLRPAVWNWMWQFARRCNHQQVLTAGKHLQAILDASMEEYHRLISEEAFDCEWKENGLLYVFRTQAGLDAFAEIDQMLTQHFGVSANQVAGSALPAFDAGLRPGLAGAFHYPGDASLRPDRLNRQWAERLRENGVVVVEDCRVQEFRKSGNRVAAAASSQGEFTADAFVVALGAWSSEWSAQLECRLPIQPGKGYSVTVPRPEQAPVHPILFPEHKVGVSPFEDGLRLGSMMEFCGYDRSIPPARIQQLRDAARPYLVASVDGEAVEQWYGWRPMTWDSLPIIGAAPELPNTYLATGHNMLGLSLAPATGRLIAELVTQQTPHIDVSPYSVTRF